MGHTLIFCSMRTVNLTLNNCCHGDMKTTPAGYKIDQTSRITQTDGLALFSRNFRIIVRASLLLSDLWPRGSISQHNGSAGVPVIAFTTSLLKPNEKWALPPVSECWLTVPDTVIHTFDYIIPSCDFSNWFRPQRNKKNCQTPQLRLWMNFTNNKGLCLKALEKLLFITVHMNTWRE